MAAPAACGTIDESGSTVIAAGASATAGALAMTGAEVSLVGSIFAADERRHSFEQQIGNVWKALRERNDRGLPWNGVEDAGPLRHRDEDFARDLFGQTNKRAGAPGIPPRFMNGV